MRWDRWDRLLVYILLLTFCLMGGEKIEAGELKHIIKDNDVITFGDPRWDEVYCKDDCCWTNILTREEFNIFKKEGNWELKYWSMKKCQNCGIIIVYCSGMDWFKYVCKEKKR